MNSIENQFNVSFVYRKCVITLNKRQGIEKNQSQGKPFRIRLLVYKSDEDGMRANGCCQHHR